MSIGSVNFDQITEVHLQALRDNQVPEGLLLEYKSEPYWGLDPKKRDDRNREALKDISAFANSSGGDIVIGIKARQGVPSEINGIEIDADQEIARLENLVRDGIEPRIRVQMRWFPIANGNKVILIRVPKSWSPPHRVRVANWNKFFVRNSNGVHEASVDELRRLFTQSSDLSARIRAVHEERLSALQTGDFPLLGSTGPKLAFHVIPFNAASDRNLIDGKALEDGAFSFPTIYPANGLNRQFNINGVAIYPVPGKGPPLCYTQVFRTGIVEIVSDLFLIGDIGNGATGIRINGFPEIYFEQVLPSLRSIVNLGISAPFVFSCAFTGVAGQVVAYVGQFDFGRVRREQLRSPVLSLPQVLIEELADDQTIRRAFKPMFDALWNAAGLPVCDLYNADGDWIGKETRRR